jgi:hypothetical protein
MTTAHDLGKHQACHLSQGKTTLGQAQPTPGALGFQQVNQQNHDDTGDSLGIDSMRAHGCLPFKPVGQANFVEATSLERACAWLSHFIF